MIKDNPVYPFSKKVIRQYHKMLRKEGKKVRDMLKKHNPTIFNQSFLEKWLFKVADKITEDTRRLILESVEQVIVITLNTYNELHQGKKLSDFEILELKTRIFHSFLLTEFKGKTLDQRLSYSNNRLKGNLQRELLNYITGQNTGNLGHVSNIINSITGKEYKEGGTALRWNSRLVLSEIFRAYQYTARIVLEELGVEEVKWVNSPRHKEGGKLIDEYAKKTYKPKDLPEYPYPCNDSYFIPVYKKEDFR